MAVALHAMPTRATSLRRSPLPDGVTDLLKVALGQEAAVAAGVAATGSTSTHLIDAAKFFVEQLVLARECESDPWRTLGVVCGAPLEQIAENRRLLLSLIHPDRSDEWAEGYADRLHRAWKLLKSPESRRMLIERTLQQSAGAAEGTAVAADGHWDERPARHESYAPHGGGMGEHESLASGMQVTAREGNPQGRTLPRLSPRMWMSVGGGCALLLAALMLWPEEPGLANRTQLANERAAAISQAIVAGGTAEDEQLGSRETIAAADALQPIEEPRLALAEVSDDPRVETKSVSRQSRASTGVVESANAGVITVSASAPDQDSGANSGANSDAVELRPLHGQQTPTQQSPAQQSGAAPQGAASPKRVATAGRERSLTEGQGNTRKNTLSASPLKPSSAVAVAERPVAPVAERVAAQTVTPAKVSVLPTSREAADVLDKFAVHYAKGNLDALLALFSSHRLSDGGASIAADYGNLFSSTRERSLALKGIGWMAQDDRLVGQGSYEARYRQQGKRGKQLVSGRIQFELVREGETIRFARVSAQESAL